MYTSVFLLWLHKIWMFKLICFSFNLHFWRRSVVVITTTQLHSTKPELRFGDSRWWGSLAMVPVGNKAEHLSSVNHTTKTIHHYHHHHHHHQFIITHKSFDVEKMSCVCWVIRPDLLIICFWDFLSKTLFLTQEITMIHFSITK